jgi:hypothetical protein
LAGGDGDGFAGDAAGADQLAGLRSGLAFSDGSFEIFSPQNSLALGRQDTHVVGGIFASAELVIRRPVILKPSDDELAASSRDACGRGSCVAGVVPVGHDSPCESRFAFALGREALGGLVSQAHGGEWLAALDGIGEGCADPCQELLAILGMVKSFLGDELCDV